MENENIICISNTTWHGPYTKSTVQLLSRLGARNRILFVEYPFTVKDIFTTLIRKQRAPLAMMLGFKKRMVKEKTAMGNTVWRLVVPPVLPFDFRPDWLFRSLNRISSGIYLKAVKKAMKKLKMKDPVVITAYNPFYGLPLLGKFNEKLHVYYCYDATDVGKHGPRAVPLEKEYGAKTDGIIVTSEHLQKQKKTDNPNCAVVKNGVEFDLFHRFAKKIREKKESVKIGYIGSIDERFDTTIIMYAALKRPSWTFELTGDLRNEAAFRQLQRLDNVRFRPAVKPEEVPLVMQDFDAGIIPYLRNEANRNIYPLKINEYLAMGIPVVMTGFASLGEFDGLVSVANDEDSFFNALESEISSDSDAKRAKRIEAARGNSWDERSLKFSELLDEMLRIKNGKIHA